MTVYHRMRPGTGTLLLLLSAGCGTPSVGSDPAVLAYLEQTLWTPSRGGQVVCAYEEVGPAQGSERYLWAICEEVAPGADEPLGGRSGPVVLTLGPEGAPETTREPRDGAAYSGDVERLFPASSLRTIQSPRANNNRVERLLAALRLRADALGAG